MGFSSAPSRVLLVRPEAPIAFDFLFKGRLEALRGGGQNALPLKVRGGEAAPVLANVPLSALWRAVKRKAIFAWHSYGVHRKNRHAFGVNDLRPLTSRRRASAGERTPLRGCGGFASLRRLVCASRKRPLPAFLKNITKQKPMEEKWLILR